MSQLLQFAQSWLSSDNVIGEHPDRQVLVVGDTIVGYTLTLLLHQAGFDPLLVTASDRAYESEITYLWPAAVQTLEFVGVDFSMLEYSTAVDNITVRDRTEPTENKTNCYSRQAGKKSPMVVPTKEVRGLLKELSTAKSRSIDRRVETFSSRDHAEVIEFADGIREWFDLVLYADNPEMAAQSRKGDPVDTSPLTQYEIALSGEELSCENPQCIDIRTPEAHVQSVPRQTSECLIRITASRAPVDSIRERVAGQLPVEATASLDAAIAETAPSTIRQTTFEDRRIDTSWWGSGRVGYFGQAVCACTPASGFSPSFGIEDALAFVTELARNDGPGTDVVTTYADQRTQRLRTLLRTVRLARPDYVDLSSVQSDSLLKTVWLLRSVSLAPLFGGRLLSTQQTAFGYW